MRLSILGLAAALATALLTPTGRAHAQSVGVDPFQLYYGYYLPHQAAIAAQPTPMDTINQNIARNQFAAQADRPGLYDPVSPYGDDEDTLAPYGSRRNSNRRLGAQGFVHGPANAVSRGSGPATYYNRTARYFPELRIGRGPNRNLAAIRSGRGGGGGGGMGMPSMPSMGPR